MNLPLLSQIEKLITEHGSAKILKERIALANDKYAALEQKLSECKLRTKNLETENETLRLDNIKFKEQRQVLEGKLSEKRHKELLEEQHLADILNNDIEN